MGEQSIRLWIAAILLIPASITMGVGGYLMSDSDTVRWGNWIWRGGFALAAASVFIAGYRP